MASRATAGGPVLKKPAVIAGVAAVVSFVAWALDRPIVASLLVATALAVACAFLVRVACQTYPRLGRGTFGATGLAAARRPLALWKRVAGLAMLTALGLAGPRFVVASSDAYRLALAAASGAPRYLEVLGAPVQESWLIRHRFEFR